MYLFYGIILIQEVKGAGFQINVSPELMLISMGKTMVANVVINLHLGLF